MQKNKSKMVCLFCLWWNLSICFIVLKLIKFRKENFLVGRVADTGTDPIPLIKESLSLSKELPKAQLLWASVREVVNIFEADRCGCDIITVPHDILAKSIKMVGYNQRLLSLETVQMFYHDSLEAGY
jgi:transaldolase